MNKIRNKEKEYLKKETAKHDGRVTYVTVTKEGKMYLNGTPVTEDNLTNELITLKAQLEKPELVVKADERVKSAKILEIMNSAQDAEYKKLIVAGEPLSKKEQKDLEEKAFILGGSNYFAPVQRFEDFDKNIKSTFIGTVEPSYKPGVTLTNLNDIMPSLVSETLKDGIKFFNNRLHGFANPDSILTGMETRSSSPVRILRDGNLVSNIRGIYPCGEGAGYAGGIMSAAVDGIKCAIAAIK